MYICTSALLQEVPVNADTHHVYMHASISQHPCGVSCFEDKFSVQAMLLLIFLYNCCLASKNLNISLCDHWVNLKELKQRNGFLYSAIPSPGLLKTIIVITGCEIYACIFRCQRLQRRFSLLFCRVRIFTLSVVPLQVPIPEQSFSISGLLGRKSEATKQQRQDKLEQRLDEVVAGGGWGFGRLPQKEWQKAGAWV